MKKDGLIKYERNHARHLLFILRKLEHIDEILTLKAKIRQFDFKTNKLYR